jgi:hypothetical protein
LHIIDVPLEISSAGSTWAETHFFLPAREVIAPSTPFTRGSKCR